MDFCQNHEVRFAESGYIIDFDREIAGTFSYSRELTAEESENWMHGGKIYDSNGYELYQDINNQQASDKINFIIE